MLKNEKLRTLIQLQKIFDQRTKMDQNSDGAFQVLDKLV